MKTLNKLLKSHTKTLKVCLIITKHFNKLFRKEIWEICNNKYADWMSKKPFTLKQWIKKRKDGKENKAAKNRHRKRKQIKYHLL